MYQGGRDDTCHLASLRLVVQKVAKDGVSYIRFLLEINAGDKKNDDIKYIYSPPMRLMKVKITGGGGKNI